MSGNLFLSRSIPNPEGFTWLEDPIFIKTSKSYAGLQSIFPMACKNINWNTPESEYRSRFLPNYKRQKSRLENPITPFSSLTSDLRLYKSTPIHHRPVLVAHDPVAHVTKRVHVKPPKRPNPLSVFFRTEYQRSFQPGETYPIKKYTLPPNIIYS